MAGSFFEEVQVFESFSCAPASRDSALGDVIIVNELDPVSVAVRDVFL